MLPEDLERLRHLAHLVLAADLDAGLQVAARHPAHGPGQGGEPGDQEPADEEPQNQRGAADPQDVQRHQQRSPKVQGRLRLIGGGQRLLLQPDRESAHRDLERVGDGLVAGEVAKLVPEFGEVFPPDRERAVLGQTQLVDRVQGLPQLPGRPVADRVERPEGAGGGRPEPLLQRFDQLQVVLHDHVGDQAARQVPTRVHGAQRLLVHDLHLRAAHLKRRRVVAEFPEAGRHVEDLVIQQGNDELVELAAPDDGRFLELSQPLLQDDAALHRDLDVPQVAGERLGELPESRRPLAGAQFGGQLDDAGGRLQQVELRDGIVRSDLGLRVGRELPIAGLGYQAGRGGGEAGGELSDLDGVGQRRDVLRVDLALDPADLEERDERDDAGDQGEDDGRAEAGGDLDAQALAERELPPEPATLLRGGGLGRGFRLVRRSPIGSLRFRAALLGRQRRFPRQRFAERADDRESARPFRLFLRLRRRLRGGGTRLGVRSAVLPVFRFLVGHPVTSVR